MKKSLLVFCLALTANTLSAQHHFPKDSAEWKVWHKNTGVPSSSGLLTHSIVSDTVLRGEAFSVIKRGLGGGLPAYIREVDSTQRVYFLYDYLDTATRLLYDFSKSIGDTVVIIDDWGDTVNWEVVKDSTLIIGSQQRRFIDVRRDYFGYIQTDRWIEGIGSIHGLFAPIDEPPGYFERHFELICFENKGTSFQYEPHPQYDCNTPKQVFSVEETRLRKIKSFPNPFGNQLQIENGSDAALRFSLFSPTGAEWTSGRLGPYENMEIKTQHLPRGIYLIRYFSEGRSASQKLVKK